MGYRIYLGSISNKRLKQIKDVSSKIELFKIINNAKDGDFDEEDCYCGVYDVSEQRLHEFGKYIEWTEDLKKQCSKPVFKNKAFNKEYTQEHDFFLINKDGLKHIINDLNNDMFHYMMSMNILVQMYEILSEDFKTMSDERKEIYNEIKTKLKEHLKYDYGDFSLNIDELVEHEEELNYVKDMIFRKIRSHFLGQVYDYKINPRNNQPNFLNLGETDVEKYTITNSWFKDKSMLELVHILKTFDFKHNKLLIYGY